MSIELIKQALLFYSNKGNYTGKPSMIEMDNGELARFALNMIDMLEEKKREDEEYVHTLLNNNNLIITDEEKNFD